MGRLTMCLLFLGAAYSLVADWALSTTALLRSASIVRSGSLSGNLRARNVAFKNEWHMWATTAFSPSNMRTSTMALYQIAHQNL